MTSQKRPKAFGAFAGSHDLWSLESTPDEGIYGLGIFAARFLQYLLRYSDFEEFHLFNLGLPSQKYEPAFLKSDERVRIRPLHEFERALDEVDFTVLHNSWGPDIGPWIDLRNRISNRAIPVTGLTHTISYQSFLPRTLLTMVLGMKAWDSVICTADSAVTAMRNWIDVLREQFGKRLGLDFEGRLDKIPLAVDSELFCRRGKADQREHFKLPLDQVIVLYVGRFSPYDKMDLAPLLIAFKQAVQDSSFCTLVLGGADSRFHYADQVKELAANLGIADSVHILRDISDADIPRLYGAADIFVSPSDNLQETFGQTIIEAMSSELPVVCSDWDGYRDLVVHEETGYLIPTLWQRCDSRICDYASMWEPAVPHFFLSQTVSVDVDSMAASLRELIANAELRAKMGARGRRRVLDLFDWRVVIRNYMDLWEELNQVASKQEFSAQPSSWYRPNFFSTFDHYATSVLEPMTEVRATRNEYSIPPHNDLVCLMRPEVITAIREHAQETISVAMLENKIRSEHRVSEEEFLSHLLWMLKYHEMKKV